MTSWSRYLNYPAGIHKATRKKTVKKDKSSTFNSLFEIIPPKLAPSAVALRGNWNWTYLQSGKNEELLGKLIPGMFVAHEWHFAIPIWSRNLNYRFRGSNFIHSLQILRKIRLNLTLSRTILLLYSLKKHQTNRKKIIQSYIIIY